jgi:hypothetical protein
MIGTTEFWHRDNRLTAWSIPNNKLSPFQISITSRVSDPDPHWFRSAGSGSGPRRAKKPHKKEKVKKCIVLKVLMFSFEGWTAGFSCTLDFLHECLIIYYLKIMNFIFNCKILQFLGTVSNGESGSDTGKSDPATQRSKMLDPDPHWIQSEFTTLSTGIDYIIISMLKSPESCGKEISVPYLVPHVPRYTVHLIVSRSWALNQSSTSDVSPSALHEQN